MGIDYRCIHCGENIPVGGLRKNKRYCNTCLGFLHRRCGVGSGRYGCPKCGASYCYPIKMITPDLVTRLEANTRKKTIFEFPGVEPPNIVGESAEQLKATVQREVRSERIWSTVLGLFLLVTAPFMLYLWIGSLEKRGIFHPIQFLLFGIGAGGTWFGIRMLIFGVWRREPDSPSKLAERFYKEALSADPLNPHKMLDLLAPAAVSVIPKPWDTSLMNSWYAARDTCRQLLGVEIGGFGFGFSRVAVSTRPDSPVKDVVVEIGIEQWNDYDTWDLKRTIILRFRNVAILHDGAWKLLSPLAGERKELPAAQ